MRTLRTSSVRFAFAIILSVLFLPAKAQPSPILQTIPVGQLPWHLICDGPNIWVSNQGDGTVTKLRANDGSNLGTFPVGSTPADLTFDGTNIWTANYGSANVTKLRASDGVSLGTFAVSALPSGIAYDGANIWVTSVQEGTITKLRASDGVILGEFHVGGSPLYALFDGRSIWVSVFDNEALLELDPTNGTVLGRVTVGHGPSLMAFDGVKIWVALNVVPGMFTVVRADDVKIVGTVTTSDSGIGGLTFDGRQIWTTDLGANEVKKFAANTGDRRGGGGPVNSPLGMCSTEPASGLGMATARRSRRLPPRARNAFSLRNQRADEQIITPSNARPRLPSLILFSLDVINR